MAEFIATKPSKTRTRIYIHTLVDGEALLEVVWWEDLAKKLKPEQIPVEGDRLRVTGQLNDYRGKLQLQPKRASDIEIIK